MSTDPSIPPVPQEHSPPAFPAVVPAGEDKTVAIIAYLTIVGFIAAIFLKTGEKKNALGQFHLRQALGLLILLIGGMIAFMILIVMLGSFLGRLFGFTYNVFLLAMLVLFVLGVMDAINGKRKPVPVVGELIQQKLAGAFSS